MKFVALVSKKIIGHPWAVIPWLAFLLFFGLSSRVNMPHGIHSWAQADRLAVAYCFFENDLDFLRPATYSLNSEDGRVGVEFPGVQYVSAALAKISGIDYLPTIYRWVNFTLLICSLLYLAFGIVNLRIRWLLTLSPVLLFYGYGFLPDTSALAMCYLGFGAFLRSQHHLTAQKRILAVSLVFFALAALFKATAGIYLLIFGGYIVIASLRDKAYKTAAFYLSISTLLVTAVVLFDYYYVIRTNERLWSVIFMSQPNRITSMEDISQILSGLWVWIPEYFGWLNGSVFFLAALLLISEVFSRRLNANKLWFGSLATLGTLGVLYFFGKQFINHDYYFLSSFYFLASLMIYSFVKRGAERFPGVFKANGLWFLLIALSAITVLDQAKARGEDHYKTRNIEFNNHVDWLKGGKAFLDSQNMHGDAVIFVLYEDAPNLALLYFGRKGMTFNFEELSRERPPLYYWKKRLQPDYFIVRDIWYSRLPDDVPELYENLEVFLESGKYLVLKEKQAP